MIHQYPPLLAVDLVTPWFNVLSSFRPASVNVICTTLRAPLLDSLYHSRVHRPAYLLSVSICFNLALCHSIQSKAFGPGQWSARLTAAIGRLPGDLGVWLA